MPPHSRHASSGMGSMPSSALAGAALAAAVHLGELARPQWLLVRLMLLAGGAGVGGRRCGAGQVQASRESGYGSARTCAREKERAQPGAQGSVRLHMHSKMRQWCCWVVLLCVCVWRGVECA
eukprot:251064-Chlamydomonas_euryale.AAC.1